MNTLLHLAAFIGTLVVTLQFFDIWDNDALGIVMLIVSFFVLILTFLAAMADIQFIARGRDRDDQ